MHKPLLVCSHVKASVSVEWINRLGTTDDGHKECHALGILESQLSNYPFYLQSSVKDNLFSVLSPPRGGHATHCSKFEVPFWLPLRDPF